MKKKIIRYLKVWWLMSRNSFLASFFNRSAFVIFLIGKLIRFAIFLFFLVFLLKGTKDLAGYTVNQTVFFFLTFNLVDIFSQFLFREVYRFRPLIVTGSFDLVLSKPINALFRSLMGGADIIDFVTIPPLLVAIFVVGRTLNPTLFSFMLYILLLLNAFILATAFHIAVLALGIVTLEIDHTIIIYRDLISLGRFPIDIYKQPLQGVLTYLVPVGIMITLPAKALMGLIAPFSVLIAFVVSLSAIFLSLRFWNYALKQYSGASS